MNTLFDRECSSSGCESGWTLYFEHEDSFLSSSPNQKGGNNFITIDGNHGTDEEDLSMVSDASSGPPHWDADEYYGNECYNNGNRKENNEHRPERVQKQQISTLLDDTASSPLFNFSSKNLAHSNIQNSTENLLDFSQGHSSTQFKGKPKFQEHYGYCKSPASGTKLQHNHWIERKRVGMK